MVIVNEVGTLKKGLDILWLIIENGNLTVLEIMDILSLNRSTAYRLVNTLEQNRLIEKNAENTFEVSRQLMEKLHDMSFNFDLESSILKAADEFKDQLGETIFVGVLYGDQVIATHIIPGKFPTRTHYEKGEKLPVYQSAVGKCILAFQPPASLENYKAKWGEPDNWDSLSIELEQIQQEGFAIDNEQAEVGVRCIAAPIWRDNRIIAGIAITGPSTRVSKEMDEKNSMLVKRFSQKNTESLTSS
jgi:IclR family transcriptional regulator, KDG regulon repressor